MTINQPPEATVEVLDDGTLRIVQPERTYRYLMSTGDVVTVKAVRDDSDVRQLVLEHIRKDLPAGDEHGKLRIEGSVRMEGPPPPAVFRKKVKR